jgi:hypothetical protein
MPPSSNKFSGLDAFAKTARSRDVQLRSRTESRVIELTDCCGIGPAAAFDVPTCPSEGEARKAQRAGVSFIMGVATDGAYNHQLRRQPPAGDVLR